MAHLRSIFIGFDFLLILIEFDPLHSGKWQDGRTDGEASSAHLIPFKIGAQNERETNFLI